MSYVNYVFITFCLFKYSSSRKKINISVLTLLCRDRLCNVIFVFNIPCVRVTHEERIIVFSPLLPYLFPLSLFFPHEERIIVSPPFPLFILPSLCSSTILHLRLYFRIHGDDGRLTSSPHLSFPFSHSPFSSYFTALLTSSCSHPQTCSQFQSSWIWWLVNLCHKMSSVYSFFK